jgi:hypothetical protein
MILHIGGKILKYVTSVFQIIFITYAVSKDVVNIGKAL